MDAKLVIQQSTDLSAGTAPRHTVMKKTRWIAVRSGVLKENRHCVGREEMLTGHALLQMNDDATKVHLVHWHTTKRLT